MNIKKYIKECYEVAREKGFYPDDSKIEDHLMGIVSELGEAYEAHRGGKFSDYGDYSLDDLIIDMSKNTSLKESAINVFVCDIKDSFEDELADVFIRLFNLYGWMGKDDIDLSNVIMPKAHKAVYESSVSGVLLMLSEEVTAFKYLKGDYGIVYYLLVCLCDKLGIDHDKHIQAKHEYNKTREHLHGKEY